MVLNALDSPNVKDTAQYLRHSRSLVWKMVVLDLNTPDSLRDTDSDDMRTNNLPPMSIDVVARWRGLDDALTHPSYSNVTSISVNCHLSLHMLPPGYECINDLFADLLPRQRSRMVVRLGSWRRCDGVPNGYVRCPYHEAGENPSVQRMPQSTTNSVLSSDSQGTM